MHTEIEEHVFRIEFARADIRHQDYIHGQSTPSLTISNNNVDNIVQEKSKEDFVDLHFGYE